MTRQQQLNTPSNPSHNLGYIPFPLLNIPSTFFSGEYISHLVEDVGLGPRWALNCFLRELASGVGVGVAILLLTRCMLSPVLKVMRSMALQVYNLLVWTEMFINQFSSSSPNI